MTKHNITSLEHDMEMFDKNQTTTSDIRQQLIEKAVQYAEKIDLSKITDPEELTAANGTMSNLASLLNDQDRSFLQRTNVKFKQRDQDDNKDTSKNISELLKMLTLGKVNIDTPVNSALSSSEIDVEVDKHLNDNNITIDETELKTDSSDFT